MLLQLLAQLRCSQCFGPSPFTQSGDVFGRELVGGSTAWGIDKAFKAMIEPGIAMGGHATVSRSMPCSAATVLMGLPL